jgi:16S rRNA (guanine(527)-N(7))-methyltransferase RsmG
MAPTDVEPCDLEGDVTKLVEMVRATSGAGDAAAGQRLVRLARTILRWNKAINLISRKDIARLVTYHFCDSASVLPLLGSPIRDGRPIHVLDVGGSNGLPGLVLGALVPSMRVVVCDSRQKRRGFLEEACLENAVFQMGRVDSPELRARWAASFDLIVARAVTRFRLLVRWAMPLLKPGGRLVAYKGSRCTEEVDQAGAYLFDHGGRMAAVVASPWARFCNQLRIFAIAERNGMGRQVLPVMEDGRQAGSWVC